MIHETSLIDAIGRYDNELKLVLGDDRFPLFVLFLMANHQPTTLQGLSSMLGHPDRDVRSVLNVLVSNRWIEAANGQFTITGRAEAFLRAFGLVGQRRIHNVIPSLVIGLGDVGGGTVKLIKAWLEEDLGADFPATYRFMLNDTGHDGDGGERGLDATLTSWFSRSEDRPTPGPWLERGAAQWRQLGRLALFDPLRTTRANTREIMRTARELVQQKKPYNLLPDGLEVHLISSLAGGAGGILVDMAHVVRQALIQEDVHQQRLVMHLFVPPRLTRGLDQEDQDAATVSRANSLAALRELDRYMTPVPLDLRATRFALEGRLVDLLRVYELGPADPSETITGPQKPFRFSTAYHQSAAEIKLLSAPPISALLPPPDPARRVDLTLQFLKEELSAR